MRKGWKIIADDGKMIDGAALKTVVTMIKDMEYQVSKSVSDCIIIIFIVQGFTVPDRITVKVAWTEDDLESILFIVSFGIFM